MRYLLPLIMILGGCSQQAADQTLATGTFVGEGRDRLCIAGEPGSYRAGLIAYGKGDTNCTASGSVDAQGGQMALVPRGETSCRIPLTVDGNSVRIGEAPAACSYYCGPGASLSGKAYSRSDTGSKAVDLAGDPLC
jgi:hypothetical protein